MRGFVNEFGKKGEDSACITCGYKHECVDADRNPLFPPIRKCASYVSETKVKLFKVTVAKVSNVELHAVSADEAMRLAEDSNEYQLCWAKGLKGIDAEEIKKES